MNDWIIKSPIPVECDVLNDSLKFPSRNIYCVGRNYRDHAIEMGGDPEREKPFFFQKSSDILVKNGFELIYPEDTSNFQYEVELVVAISQDAFKVGSSEAKNIIFGYIIFKFKIIDELKYKLSISIIDILSLKIKKVAKVL